MACGQKKGGTKQKKLVQMMVPISLEEDVIEGWFESIGLGDEPAFPALPPEGPQPKKMKGDSSKGTSKCPQVCKFYSELQGSHCIDELGPI